MHWWTWIALGAASLSLAAQARAQPETAPRSADASAESGASSEADAWRWPGTLIWDLELRVNIPPESAFDRALHAHRHRGGSFNPAIVVGVAVPVVPWLWLGGQLGVRGRAWAHDTLAGANFVGADAMATVRARIPLGRRLEIGALIAGGIGWIGTWVNDVLSDQLAPRVSFQADVLFSAGRHFSLGPSVGWEVFETPSPVNAYGHVADLGGFYLGLSLEGRE